MDDTWQIASPLGRFPLSEAQAKAYEAARGRKLLMGLRPEEIHEEDGPGRVAFEAEIVAVEALGTEKHRRLQHRQPGIQHAAWAAVHPRVGDIGPALRRPLANSPLRCRNDAGLPPPLERGKLGTCARSSPISGSSSSARWWCCRSRGW
ncbi:hypothetical protein [Breoghania sp.]|uniref:hypothetical protein n=1 Tax=Breoghania sp. TaxID=2065378 RepID=UPI00262DD6B6|nr:hypothetical protein [Breoghania sp.]MDJ0930731.1 hypothetical protein [Breoghania sp.]